MLTGTFVAGHTYKAVIHAYGSTAGQNWGIYLGYPGAGSFGSASAVSTGGSWQRIETTWTPATTYATGVVVAFRANREEFLANTARIDDVAVFDVAAPDTNIPSETVYDAAGRAVASVLPGGAAGDPAMVTRTGYDVLGRVTSVTANEVAGGGSGAEVNLATSTAYDALGRVSTVTDPTGTVTCSASRNLDTFWLG